MDPMTTLGNVWPMLIAGVTPQIWYGVPLIVAVSLVWGATRHERPREILIHSFRSLLWVLAFMGVIFALIYVASYFA